MLGNMGNKFISVGISNKFTLCFAILDVLKDTKKYVIMSNRVSASVNHGLVAVEEL